MQNQLYYGDNLDVLRRYVRDGTVDLVYLDPPFKSDQDYNVLFAEQDGSRAAAQIRDSTNRRGGTRHPRLQLLTVTDLLTGKTVDRPVPQGNVTFKKAPKYQRETGKQKGLFKE